MLSFFNNELVVFIIAVIIFFRCWVYGNVLFRCVSVCYTRLWSYVSWFS